MRNQLSYTPKVHNFWQQDSPSLSYQDSPFQDINQEIFNNNFVRADLTIRCQIDSRTFREIEAGNELISRNLTLEEFTLRFAKKWISFEDRKYIIGEEVEHGQKIFRNLQITVGDMCSESNIGRGQNLQISVGYFFEKKVLQLVEEKDLPNICNRFRTVPNFTRICRLNYFEMQKLENFEIGNEYGNVEFLVPVNLLNKNLTGEELFIGDKVFNISSDFVDSIFGRKDFYFGF